jgi:serine/threonine-protein kinase HipA
VSDVKTARQARVFLRDAPVGRLEKFAADRFSFTYDPAYLNSPAPLAIAVSFPLQSAPFVSSKLHAFFDNLILEGWLLEHAEKLWRIDKHNRFALLLAVGGEPIGAVSVHALDEDGNEFPRTAASETVSVPTRQEPLSPAGAGGICDYCLRPAPKGNSAHAACVKALWGTGRALRIELDADAPLETFSRAMHGGSISGAQRKGLFALDRRTGVLRSTAARSEYILKPDGSYPELPANEHVSMAIAKAAGFLVPPVTLVRTVSLGFVCVIRRFDRIDGVALRMEDMGQLTGALTEDKYDGSNEKVAAALQSHASAPPLDCAEYFRRLVFCFLIANGDMHLKNWALLEKASLNGELDLSPCYDFLNTRLALRREQIDIGLTLRGKSRNLQRSYFEKFARETLTLDPAFIRRTFEDVTDWLQLIREFVPRSHLSESAKERYLAIAEDRYRTLSARSEPL